MDLGLIQIIVAIVGLIIPLAIYLYSIKRKKMKFSFTFSTSLINVNPQIKKDIQVLYKEKLVENISMLEVKISNIGNVPIEANDVITPISFEFNENVNVISSDIFEKNPTSIILNIHNPKPEVKTCLFALLNPKDYVKIRFTLLGNTVTMPKVNGHIVGCTFDIEDIAYSKKASFKYLAFGFLTGAFTAFVAGLYIFGYNELSPILIIITTFVFSLIIGRIIFYILPKIMD